MAKFGEKKKKERKEPLKDELACSKWANGQMSLSKEQILAELGCNETAYSRLGLDRLLKHLQFVRLYVGGKEKDEAYLSAFNPSNTDKHYIDTKVSQLFRHPVTVLALSKYYRDINVGFSPEYVKNDILQYLNDAKKEETKFKYVDLMASITGIKRPDNQTNIAFINEIDPETIERLKKRANVINVSSSEQTT